MDAITTDDKDRLAQVVERIMVALGSAPANVPWFDRASNQVFAPLAEAQQVALTTALGIAGVAGVRPFYSLCNGFDLPDFRNGYFVFGLDAIQRGLARGQPASLSAPWNCRVVVIGADGGGGLFALQPESRGDVLYLSEGRIINSEYQVTTGGVRVVSETLVEFVERVAGDVTAYVAHTPEWQYLI